MVKNNRLYQISDFTKYQIVLNTRLYQIPNRTIYQIAPNNRFYQIPDCTKYKIVPKSLKSLSLLTEIAEIQQEMAKLDFEAIEVQIWHIKSNLEFDTTCIQIKRGRLKNLTKFKGSLILCPTLPYTPISLCRIQLM